MDVTTIAVTVLLAVLAATAAILATRARMQASMVAAGTRLAQAEQRADSLAQERDSCRRERDAAVAAQTAAERERAVAVQRLADMEMRIADFERLKSESLKAAQAAILGTAQQLSSKLIEDHRRESAEAKKQGEAKLKETADHLLKQVEQITQSVAQLQGQVSEKGQVLDTVWRALTSPGGAGRFAEVGLANTLRSFGLEEGRDFMLQHTTQDADTGR
ncbi:MAG TPA: DNA recombination protein RmuC, partial [Stellaceae bacterium]